MGKTLEHIGACIFDLDGVLVDTAVFHFQSWQRLAAEFGFSLNDSDNEELKGVSRMGALEIVLQKGGVEVSEAQKLELAERKNTWYRELIASMHTSDVLPGVKEFLEFLVARKVPIGVASASKNAPTILAHTGLEQYFAVRVDGNRTLKAKPDPEVFLTCAAELGVDPARCVVFEDAIAGVQGAKTAGMTAIGIGHPAVLTQADLVFPGIHAIDPQIFSFQPISLT